jgi:hypothetical protein
VPIPLEGKNGPILQEGRNRQRVYKADFVYWDNALQCEVIEDAKGYPTPEYKLKRAILKAMGVEIVEV